MLQKLKDNADYYAHYCMSMSGGIMGAYAILINNGNLGSAETANMIYIVLKILGNSIPEALMRIGALCIYIIAIQFTVLFPKFVNINMKKLSVVLDCIAVIALAVVPEGTNYVLSLYPMFFVLPIQWVVFKGADDFVSSSIFSTNNLRQFASAWAELIYEKTDLMKKKFKFYGITLLSFHLGVAVSFFAVKYFQRQGIFVCFLPLAAAFAVLNVKSNFSHNNKKLVSQ